MSAPLLHARPHLFLLLCACNAVQPPPLGDGDSGSKMAFVSDPVDAGIASEGGDAAGQFAFYTDYEGACPAGMKPIWRFHDFQTKTPADSAISFSAQSAGASADLAAGASVLLARVTGPDITVWAGVDVDPKLTAANQKSLRFLRVKTTFELSSDGGAPTLVAVRQQFDCIQAL